MVERVQAVTMTGHRWLLQSTRSAQDQHNSLDVCGQSMAWAGMGSDAICEARFGKSSVKSELLARVGVMTICSWQPQRGSLCMS